MSVKREVAVRSGLSRGLLSQVAGAGLLLGGLVLLWWRAGWASLFALMGFVLLVAMHEFGHFVAARRAGMLVEEFFIGFGPRIWSMTRGETTYGVKAILGGAYVRVSGMNNLEVVRAADEHRTYRHARYRDRMLMALAGPTTNLALGFAGLVALFMSFGFIGIDLTLSGAPDGWNTSREWAVVSLPGSTNGDAAVNPAAAMGIEAGDRITALGGTPVYTFSELQAAVAQQAPGANVDVTLVRGGSELSRSGNLGIAAGTAGEQRAYLGVRGGIFEQVPQPLGPVDAFGAAASESLAIVGFAATELVGLFSPETIGGLLGFGGADAPAGEPQADSGVRGPIGLVHMARDASVEGLLTIWVLVNVFVGLFNLIPMLPFDGGHATIATYEKIRSRPGRRYVADIGRLMPVVYPVLAILIILGSAIAFRDIERVIS